MGNSDSRAELRGVVEVLCDGTPGVEDGAGANAPVPDSLWDQLWDLPSSSGDVFFAIQPEDARSLLAQEPGGRLQQLLIQAATQLAACVDGDELPSPRERRRALNAVRVLTRVLPFVLESSHLPVVSRLLWDPAAFDGETTFGDALVELVGRLLFLPGLTIAQDVARVTPRRLEAGGGTKTSRRRASFHPRLLSSSSRSLEVAVERGLGDGDGGGGGGGGDGDGDGDYNTDDSPAASPLGGLDPSIVRSVNRPVLSHSGGSSGLGGSGGGVGSGMAKNSSSSSSSIGGGGGGDGGGGGSTSSITSIGSSGTAGSISSAPSTPVGTPGLAASAERARASSSELGSQLGAGGSAGESIEVSLLWQPGLGSGEVEPTGARKVDAALVQARLELLKLLLVCQSEVLFQDAGECRPEQCKWLQSAALRDYSVAPAGGLPFARELFCSLVNQACALDPVGWGLPYGAALDPRAEEASLADSSLHCLLVLCAVPSWNSVFRRMLGEPRTAHEYTFVFGSVVRLLRAAQDAESSLLPGASYARVACQQELLALLWKLFEANKDFLTFALDSGRCDVCALLRSICLLVWQGRKQPEKAGLAHICTFVLLLLSGERGFGVALNKPLGRDAARLGLDGAPKLSAAGSHADLLVVVIHKAMFDGGRAVASLYDFFLTVLSNVSPYVRSFGQPASTRLLAIFERFASKRFLLAADNNHRFVLFLLELFNNVIQYQYEGNAQLVYTLCLNHAKIRALAELEFDDADAAQAAQALQLAAASRHSIFQPTKEWFDSWKPKLPLRALVRMLDVLLPKIEAFCADQPAVAEEKILRFVRESTMVGLLPVPHAIAIRKYLPNKHTAMWFISNMWGLIFLRAASSELATWDASKVRLFQINLVREEG
jgi:hypothetical protein